MHAGHALQVSPEPPGKWEPRSPGSQVVQQVVANLGLLLIQLGEKVQEQRKAAVVLLHLAQVPAGGGGAGSSLGHMLPGSRGRRGHLCPLHTPSCLERKSLTPGQERVCARGRRPGRAVPPTAGRLPKYQVERLPHRLLQRPTGGRGCEIPLKGQAGLQAGVW